MEWLAPAIILAAVAGSVPLLIWYTKKRGWNVDREADTKREQE